MVQLLESKITSPTREALSLSSHGVAIFIFNSRNEILLGLENHADQHRPVVPIWNIITETWKPGIDYGIKQPVTRAVDEELGCPITVFSYIPGTYRETNGVYKKTMGYEYTYRCICLRYTGDPAIPAGQQFRATDGEVITHQWFSLDTLPEQLETGAGMLIHEYRDILRI